MNEYDLWVVVNNYIREICHISQMQVFATSYYQKNYFQMQIDDKINELIEFILHNPIQTEEETDLQVQQQTEMKNFTLEELADYNGSEGKPAYVAVNGNVYDVSNVIQWGGGTHFGLFAGKDLSSQFMGCHQGMLSMLDNIPKVGILIS